MKVAQLKIVFFIDVVFTCILLGATLIAMDSGVFMNSVIYGVSATLGFLVAFWMRSHHPLLDDI